MTISTFKPLFSIFKTSSKTGRKMLVGRDWEIGAGGTQNADAAGKRKRLARQSQPISQITPQIMIILSWNKKIVNNTKYRIYF